jgi:methyl-accepting chemotaxis protein
MKLLGKISLLIAVLVLFISLSIGILLVVLLTSFETNAAKTSLQNIAALGSTVINNYVHGQLDVFQEVANRARTRSMDWETQAESLNADIDRLDFLDFAIVNRAGQARYIQENSQADLHDRDYIIAALNGSQAVSDVLISRVTNGSVVMYAVPITQGDRPGSPVIGALIGRKNGEYLSAICRQVKLGSGSGFSFLINKEGVYIAHPEFSLVREQFNPIRAAAGNPQYRSLANAADQAIQGGSGVVDYTLDNRRFVAAYCPTGDFGWTLFTAMEYNEFMEGSHAARNLIILLVFGALLLGTFAAVMLALSITKPIKELNGAARALAALNFDIVISQNRGDELGELQKSLQVIRDNMQRKVADMNSELVEKQLNIANNLREAIRSSSDGLGVIINNMDTVRQKTGTQVSSANKASQTVEEIVRNINILDDAVETQGLNISRSSQSIEQMVQDSESVRSIVRGANRTTKKLGESSKACRKMLTQLTGELNRIAEQSVFLEEANETLMNIAAQTNILAMNAAIEAAHAGETGRGFAVVAGEVRKLAADSDKESASISEEIKRMRAGIAAIQEASAQTVEAMSGMFTEVTDMGASFDTVNHAVEAQAANSSQILSALSTLNETTELVRNGSNDMQNRSSLIQDAVEHLKGISRDVNESVHNVEEAAKNIETSLEIAYKIAEGRYLMPPG